VLSHSSEENGGEAKPGRSDSAAGPQSGASDARARLTAGSLHFLRCLRVARAAFHIRRSSHQLSDQAAA